MRVDDERHGEYRGAVAHWADKEPLCDACEIAARRYAKRRKAELHATGRRRRIPSWRVRRRVEALMALGWNIQEIANAAGMTFAAAWNLGLKQPDVYRSGFEKIDAAYQRLCMTRPEGGYATRTRNRARRRGYLPPLAWVDIDDPNERPDLTATDNLPDPVVVERILGGDWRLKATPVERAEVVARWPGSMNELERLTGWNLARDARRGSAA